MDRAKEIKLAMAFGLDMIALLLDKMGVKNADINLQIGVYNEELDCLADLAKPKKRWND